MSRDGTQLLWSPSPERRARATLTRYQQWLGMPDADYAELWRWSVTDLDRFWSSICKFFDVRFETPPSRVLGSREMAGAEWFPGASLSCAAHIFRGKADDAPALQHAGELRELGSWTWGELRAQTAQIAAGLRALGVGEGDRVVAYLPNIPEAIAAFLACASIGAIWSSCSPDFGAPSVVDRFAQIEPKVMLAVDGYRYGGRDFDRREVVAGISAQIPSVEHVITLGYLDGGGWPAGFLPAGGRCCSALPGVRPP